MVAVHRHKPSRDDALRVRRAQAGDPAAFDELIDAHRDLLERVVRHFVRNGSDVEDVTHEAWIRAATHIRDLREPDRFRPWLRTIARNSCMTFLKRQRHDRGVATLDNDEAPQIADPDEGTPEAHVLSRDEQRKVWETLGALSERDRMALFYREYQGLPYPEIAERLSISRNAAEVCVFRARERFRRLYYRVESDEARCEFNGLQLCMYMDGDLDEVTQRRVMKHLQSCGQCVQRLEAMTTGRDVYQKLAGLVIMPGASGGILASLQGLIATIAAWFGGGGGAAGGAAAASGVTAAAGASSAATIGAAGTAVGVAAAAGGGGASMAGAVAASIIVGAVLVGSGVPAATPAEQTPLVTASAMVLATPSPLAPLSEPDIPALPSMPPAQVAALLPDIVDEVDEVSSAATENEPTVGPPAHAAVVPPPPPLAERPARGEPATALPGGSAAPPRTPPAQAAPASKPGDAAPKGLPEHAPANDAGSPGSHRNEERAGPPATANLNSEQGSSRDKEPGAPPDHAQTGGAGVRGTKAMTSVEPSPSPPAHASAGGNAGTSGNGGGPPAHSSAGGNAGNSGNGNGPPAHASAGGNARDSGNGGGPPAHASGGGNGKGPGGPKG